VPPYFKPSQVERAAKNYADNAKVAADLAAVLFQEETKGTDTATAWECVAGDMDEVITECARFADLLMLGQFDTENPPRVSHFSLPAKIILGAATPILVVPNTGMFSDVGRHPLVTWDGSREAARAIRDAMPLLEAAERVSLLAIDPLRQDHMHEGPHASALVAYLGHHGVRAEMMEVAPGGKGVATELLECASLLGADLLVMGASGHSRVWQFLVGGTMQDLLERTKIPVLMSG
jgi:nucleotide-binding universal stress UspA family protein